MRERGIVDREREREMEGIKREGIVK